MNRFAQFSFAAAFATIATGLSFTPATAASVADFYKGKTVIVYIGYSSGSTYDRYARTLRRHMNRHIPGNPKMIPKNMGGAGSLRLTNFMYGVAPKDGTAIAAVGRTMASEPLMLKDKSKAAFDAQKFNWLGSINTEVSISASWHKSGVKTIKDAQTKVLIVGAASPSSQSGVFPRVMNTIIGTKFKTVCCYPGGNLMNLAMERGEIEGRATWSWSSVKATKMKWVKQGKIHIIAQQALAKHPDLPNVPLTIDLAKSEADKQILRLIFSGLAMGRPYVAPPGVPKDRVKALRAAFVKTYNDPKFLAEAKKRRLSIDRPMTGKAVQKLVADIYKTPKDVVDRAAQAVQSGTVTKRKTNYRTVKSSITKIQKKGRVISFKDKGKTVKAFINRRATKVKIGGKKAKGSKLKVGMGCSITYEGDKTLAKAVSC